jgi:preprotein translocase subunit YajC
MMVVLFGLMWLLLIRPQQRKQRQQQSLLSSLDVGQEVMTAGGLYGTISDVDIEEVVLEIAPGVNVRMDKRAVVTVVEEEVEEPDAFEARTVEEPEPATAVESEQR